MITNFQIDRKTARPACCNFACCGNNFGRIEKSFKISKNNRIYRARHHGENRIIKTRRYAKHVEKQIVRHEIKSELELFYDEYVMYGSSYVSYESISAQDE